MSPTLTCSTLTWPPETALGATPPRSSRSPLLPNITKGVRECPHAIHIEAPFKPGSDLLTQLEAQLETPDSQPCHPSLVLSLLTLEDALVNADQDEPGFRDRI